MNDDDFPNLVRSGSQHSVSVSERTGNAKTPKNVVVSDEEQTAARVRAFEQKTLAALEADKALAAALAEHTEQSNPDDGITDANILKVTTTQDSAHRQTIASDNASKANVQNVTTDVLDANLQKVGTDKIQDNIQAVGNNKGIAANVQSIPSGAIAANVQNISGGNIAANTQNIDGEKVIDTNRQGIPTDVIASNVQEIPVDGIAANVQNISGELAGVNNQAISQDNVMLNRQGLDIGPNSNSNLQALPQDDTNSNRQVFNRDGSTQNNGRTAANVSVNNEQTIAKLGIQDKQAPAPKPGTDPNIQGLGYDAPSLNHQGISQDSEPGPNRQGVENSKIQSHFEQLQTGALGRKKVDFSTPSDSRGSSTLPSKTPSVRAPLNANEQQQANLNRLNAKDAFHGRLAGIKHNVDALNHRLTDFEEKVHKEDINLDKGNPEDFDIDLN